MERNQFLVLCSRGFTCNEHGEKRDCSETKRNYNGFQRTMEAISTNLDEFEGFATPIRGKRVSTFDTPRPPFGTTAEYLRNSTQTMLNREKLKVLSSYIHPPTVVFETLSLCNPWQPFLFQKCAHSFISPSTQLQLRSLVAGGTCRKSESL